MSAEFDDFIIAVHKFSNEADDPHLFAIAERVAIQLLMDGINRVNEKILRRVKRQIQEPLP